jgi:alcohol dehydrogenase
VAAPTTSGTGTEVSPVSVIGDPELRMKIGVSSVHLIPDSAVVDPELTLSCPARVTAYSGIDAFCHAVESYLAPPRPLTVTDLIGSVFLGQNPVTDSLALRAVRVIGRSLRRAVADGSDTEARRQMALGSVTAGLAFSHAGTGCPHALQYPIGAATGTPHGLGVGLLLPYALAAARTAAASETQRRLTTLAECVGLKASPTTADPAAAFVDWVVALLADIGLPTRLADIGVQRSDLPGFAEQAQSLTRLLRNHPGPTDSYALLAILDAAWLGDLARLASHTS